MSGIYQLSMVKRINNLHNFYWKVLTSTYQFEFETKLRVGGDGTGERWIYFGDKFKKFIPLLHTTYYLKDVDLLTPNSAQWADNTVSLLIFFVTWYERHESGRSPLTSLSIICTGNKSNQSTANQLMTNYSTIERLVTNCIKHFRCKDNIRNISMRILYDNY